MKRIVYPLFATVLILFMFSDGISADMRYSGEDAVSPGSYRIIFYNVENLFDTINDTGRDDDSFTPSGDRRWNSYRLENKLNNLYRALAGAGGLGMPSVIGLCEVENRSVLEMLISRTGLKNSGYRIIHRNSSDRRGIDVAIMYRPADFMLLDTIFIPVTFPFDTLAVTRDIVYAKGIAGPDDTLHLFVNHWPSRWGGQAATQPYRSHAASVLRSFTDSLFSAGAHASIIIMGDFNDEPRDESISRYLGAVSETEDPEYGVIYNISSAAGSKIKGSYKYQGDWFLFDQFMVSGSLLRRGEGIYTGAQYFSIYEADFLLVPDESWFGYKPCRSYEGFRHTGGFSDHLPVVLDLWW